MSEINTKFWSGKKVFLTGHTGFKGSWMSLWLQCLGAKVYGYALPPNNSPALFAEAQVAEGMVSTIGDIRDYKSLYAAILKAEPEILIHMAAQPLVRQSYANPVETYETNVMGTVHLLEAARSVRSIKAIVNVTTDKCYENKEWIWGYREDEPLGGRDPYSSSKACSELVTNSYRQSFLNELGVAVATARAGNVIGGGDWAKERLIPDILGAFESGRPLIIRNPHAIRPWQHVLDPLRGYLILGENLIKHGSSFAEPWNFGPSNQDSKSVSWIAEELSSLWGSPTKWVVDSSTHPHEAKYLKLDSSKATDQLGWKPRLGLGEALAWIVEWSHEHAAGKSMREITMAQISRYQKLS
jgi:CDP-glucose 4,6-dehydratase